MVKDVKFSEETTYTGRNGRGRQIGLGFTHNGSCLLLEPINSKDYLANCQINIPYQNLLEVIANLQEAYSIQNK